MIVLVPTLFTLFYYSTLLKFPLVLGGATVVFAIDLITPFLYFWLINSKKSSMVEKALVVFFCGLATDIFLLNSIYFNSVAYLLLLILVDQSPKLKTDRLLRFLYFVAFYFGMILSKSLILSFIGRVDFFNFFLSSTLLQMPLSLFIGFYLTARLVKLVLYLQESSKKITIKTELT